MGLLINGEWRDQWYDTKKSDGKFIRQDSKYRDYIGSYNFPAEPKNERILKTHQFWGTFKQRRPPHRDSPVGARHLKGLRRNKQLHIHYQQKLPRRGFYKL